MESELSDVYYNVYCSCKEILINKQKHLYIKMLDLLQSTCKATSVETVNKIATDDLVEFWLVEVLPLVFDEDHAVQTRAIAAFEEGLDKMKVADIHSSSHWPKVKGEIITNYAPRIHKIRDDHNYCWQKIWCLIIRVLDCELLKGTSVINYFLSIVERGFRNPDNAIRTQAFLCWRTLIAIFSSYGELSMPKRLKLVCIPLKSAQSKSEESAVVKFRVWWYLLTCLGKNIHQHFEVVIEPFFGFLFGSPDRNQLGAVHQYISVRNMLLPCFAEMFNIQANTFLHAYKLETLQPSPLTTKSFLTKHWELLTNSVLYYIELIDKEVLQMENEKQILHQLIQFLVISVSSIDIIKFFNFICEKIIGMLPKRNTHVIFILNVIANTKFIHDETFNDISYSDALNVFIKLLGAAKPVLPSAVFLSCVKQFFIIDPFRKSSNLWSALRTIAKVINETSGECYEVFLTNLCVWRQTSYDIEKYVNKHTSEFSSKEYSSKLYEWIIWPLQMLVKYTEHDISSMLDMELCILLGQLIKTSEHSLDSEIFLNDINKCLQKLAPFCREKENFSILFGAYAAAVFKCNCNKNPMLFSNLFDLLKQIIIQHFTQTSIEACLDITKTLMVELQSAEIFTIFKAHISSFKMILNDTENAHIDTKFLDNWIENISKIMCQKQTGRNLMKNMVELGLNPDTEEECVVINNDISESEKSSAKPITPNKREMVEQSDALVNRKQNEFVKSASKYTEAQGKGSVLQKTENHRLKNENCISPRRTRKSSKNQEACTVRYHITTESTKPRRTRNSLQKIQKIDEGPEKVDETEKHESFLLLETATNANEIDSEIKILNSPEMESYIEIESSALKDVSPKEEREESDSLKAVAIQTQIELSQPNEIETEKNCNVLNLGANEDLSVIQDEKSISDCLSVSKTNIIELSPKRISSKLTNLLSPPDRILTTNSISPTLRPKPSAYLTGRGAQLINMIRNKKSDISSPRSPSTFQLKTNYKNTNYDRPDTPVSHLQFLGSEQAHNDILTFTKRLPSPSASPSVSILKRKAINEGIEEITAELHATKRKRVSFHDPPVSITKEYVRDTNENKMKPKRCLNMAEVKHELRRRSKLDSIIEIEQFSKTEGATEVICSLIEPTLHSNSLEANIKTDSDTLFGSERSCQNKKETVYTDMDPNTALQLIIEQLPLEIVLDKYFIANGERTVKLCNIIVKYISRHMKDNPKVKADVLDFLSETHSKDFLDYSVQENVVSTICDRLNITSVIEYICTKSKIDTTCRNNILLQLPDVLRHVKIKSELVPFLNNIFETTELTDKEILDLISTLMCLRNTNKNLKLNVPDSSSNL